MKNPNPVSLSTLRAKFKQLFKQEPDYIVRAPGRVNLIGEHTDYNEGFVLPIAINRAFYIALRPRMDDLVRIDSLDFNTSLEFSLADLSLKKGWGGYVQGMAWALTESGYDLKGWEGVTISTVPIGSGLSSSAALEIGIARAFCAVGGWEWEGAKMAEAAMKLENEWLGLKSGIMDQMISACGVKDNALLIDCRTYEAKPIPMPVGVVPVVKFTGMSRGLTESLYNERVDECQQAASFFGVPSLRDVTMKEFVSRGHLLEDAIFRRARHILSENFRTTGAAAAMESSDLVRLGKLMNASHESLRDDYEVSCFELDTIVEIARQQPGCLAARMTGAGFGGSAVAMVEAEHANAFVKTAPGLYHAQTNREPNVFICKAVDGCGLVDI